MIVRRLALPVTALALVTWSPAEAFDQVPQLSVNARIVHADGTAGSSTGSPNPMVVSQGVTSLVFASADLCGLGAAREGARDLDELRRQRGHVWKITRTGVSHTGGKLTFDLDWVRFDGGGAAPAASGRQRLTLSEGAVYPLDMIRASAPGGCNVAAVMLEVEAGTIETFADTVLQYDVWVTHKDSAGRKQTKHMVVTGKQGKPANFDFAPFRFEVPKLAPDQYNLDLVTRVMGAIKGRLREDGKVGIELETQRMDRLERPDDPKPHVPRAGGRKTLEVMLDETIEIELPKTSGFHAHVASPESPGISGRVGASTTGTPTAAPAVSLKNGNIVVSFREFFADDEFSVLIRVRKGDQ